MVQDADLNVVSPIVNLTLPDKTIRSVVPDRISIRSQVQRMIWVEILQSPTQVAESTVTVWLGLDNEVFAFSVIWSDVSSTPAHFPRCQRI